MMSDARVKCVPSTVIKGVGCGKVVNHLEADTNLHAKHLIQIAILKWHSAVTGPNHRHVFQAAVEVKLGRMAVDGQVTRPTRPANLWNLFRRTTDVATKAAGYKARQALFDPTPPIP